MIDLITRVRYMDLYEQMLRSAKRYARGRFDHHWELDGEGNPNVAETQMRLGLSSSCDLLGFVEDDVQFMSGDWDRVVEDLYAEYKFDVLGVLGCKEYAGGNTFDAGNQYGAGQVAADVEWDTYVKVLGPMRRFEPVKVVEGFIFFVPKKLLAEKPFDPQFDGIFFSDTDLCLRCEKVGVTSLILVKHSTKGPERIGKYAASVKPITAYWDAFHAKHGFRPTEPKDRRCALVPLEEYRKTGATAIVQAFREKYPCALV